MAIWLYAMIPIVYTADTRKCDQLMCETRSGPLPPPYFCGLVVKGTNVARKLQTFEGIVKASTFY